MAPRLTTRVVLFVVALALGTLMGADWTATLAARPLPHAAVVPTAPADSPDGISFQIEAAVSDVNDASGLLNGSDVNLGDTVTAAQASLAANGEVIAAYQRYAGKFAVMSPSGGAAAYVNCGGDLTYAGVPRFFINSVIGTNILPTWYFGSGGPYYNTELAASDEDCAQTTTMTHDGNKLFGSSRWSPDGTMVAAFAVEFDLTTGALLQRGIFLADVMYDSGRPAGLTNLRLAIPTEAERNFAWSPDSQRLVYVDPGINGADLFVYSVGAGTSINITNTPNVAEDQPAWSTTGRIAYTRQTSDPRGSYRYDIFAIPATGGSEVQITSKATTGSFVNMIPAFSPDGTQMLFSSGLLQGDRALYRIRADGAGKATKVVGCRNEDWRVSFWRR
jgi:hypothetical protein